MSRRFIITGVVIAALLGGLGYFQFVFKPQMVRTFLSQMKPPPATVTAEPARTEQWVERLTSIWTTPGFTDEMIHLFWATGLTLGSAAREPDEFIEVVPRPLNGSRTRESRPIPNSRMKNRTSPGEKLGVRRYQRCTGSA